MPRVGPATAQKIIDWRTKNGRFRSVQDLRSVSGIGDATFAQLKDLVTV
ncbi:ComEA family DNA-binding protein [Mesorhizobium japonicum]